MFAAGNKSLAYSNVAALAPLFRASLLPMRSSISLRFLTVLTSVSSFLYHYIQFSSHPAERYLLLVDRIFAVALTLYALSLHGSARTVVHRLRDNKWDMRIGAAAAIAGIGSELVKRPSKRWYAVLHSAWHVLIFSFLAQTLPAQYTTGQ
jgi:hypothetical protein